MKKDKPIDWDAVDWDAVEGQRQAGELLRLRRRARLSQEKMAELCGCSRTTISAMETNTANTTQYLINRYRAIAIVTAEKDQIAAIGDAVKDTFAVTAVKRLKQLLGGQ
ncbi:helix-turn-helix domain-containing protein [Bowmanella denitrificans]|uniref:helix-turn-helix domain-containing protein n=1 Tax=Bowmanella denitrificans TaxID=366582 RepID=UPI000C9CF065|nr:helix-turn-helix transcriptional regulator [Bowmanella denitrificans]